MSIMKKWFYKLLVFFGIKRAEFKGEIQTRERTLDVMAYPTVSDISNLISILPVFVKKIDSFEDFDEITETIVLLEDEGDKYYASYNIMDSTLYFYSVELIDDDEFLDLFNDNVPILS